MRQFWRKRTNSEVVRNAENIKRKIDMSKITIEDAITNIVAPIGYWQLTITIILCISAPSTSLFSNFASAMPNIRCRMEPELEDYFTRVLNFTFKDIQNFTSPPSEDKDKLGCSRYQNDWPRLLKYGQWSQLERNISESCPYGYVFHYDKNSYHHTIVEDFNLVCDRDYLSPMLTSLFMVGMWLGYIISGKLGDHFGRRYTGILFSLMETVAGLVVGLSPNYICYAILRIIVGLAATGRLVVLIILTSELTNKEYRSLVIMFWEFSTFFSRSLMALEAYFIPYWGALHTVHYILSCLSLTYFCIIPESPAWLHSKLRTVEAIEVMKRGTRLNKIWSLGRCKIEPDVQERVYQALIRQNHIECRRQSVTPPKRLRDQIVSFFKSFSIVGDSRESLQLCIISVIVFGSQTVSLYGILFFARSVKASVYMVVFLNACMSLPATIFASLLYRIFTSRKYPLIGVYLVGGIFMLLGGVVTMIFQPESDLILTITSNIALFMLSTAQNLLYVYIPELFPAKSRSQAFGNSCGWARLMAAFCTFINKLDSKYIHGLPTLIYSGLLLLSIGIICFLPDVKQEDPFKKITTTTNPSDEEKKIDRKIEISGTITNENKCE